MKKTIRAIGYEFFNLIHIKVIIFYLSVIGAIGIANISFIIGGNFTFHDMLLKTMGGIRFTRDPHELNIFETVTWLLSITPPIIVNAEYFDRHLSKQIFYTLPRFASVRQWWVIQSTVMMIHTLFYSLLLISVNLALSIMFQASFRGTILFDTDTASDILLLFPVYIITVSIILCVVFIFSKSIQNLFAVFIVLCGLTMVVGTAVTQTNSYMLGCFGMALRTAEQDQASGFDTGIVLITEFILIIISWIFISKNLASRVCFEAGKEI